MNPEKAVSHEKAQNAQREEDIAQAETFTVSVTTISTPLFGF